MSVILSGECLATYLIHQLHDATWVHYHYFVDREIETEKMKGFT